MCEIQVIEGDITKIQADIIVNAANKSLLGGGGVDGAIHRAAGPGLREECLRLRRNLPNGLRVGEIAVTSAHNLPAKWVIHTVGPMQGFDDVELLAHCYQNALMKAEELGAQSIAFPAISTGKHRVPLEVSASIVSEVMKSFNPFNLKKIVFIFNDATQAIKYGALLRNTANE